MTDWDEMVEDMGSGCPFRLGCEGPYERYTEVTNETAPQRVTARGPAPRLEVVMQSDPNPKREES